MKFQGKGAVEGIALGNTFFINDNYEEGLQNYCKEDVEIEKTRYLDSVKKAVAQLNRTIEKARSDENEELSAIMEAHAMMAQDPMLQDSVLNRIHEGEAAPIAIKKASEEMAEMLSSLEDKYLKERAADVRDVGKRILKVLLGIEETSLEGDSIILCGEDIEPSLVASLSGDQVCGLVIGSGSATSHAVIIAKAKGIVTLVGIGDQVHQIKSQTSAILDGYKGMLILDPEEDELKKYQKQYEEDLEKKAYYLSLSDLPSVTKDGKHVTLAANIGNPAEIDYALPYGCKGVGLFRTEFVFMGSNQMPTEDEQYEAYKYVIERAQGELCVIRTMDIGGDKPLEYLDIAKEENPFLGWRAIRICLERTDIFITQIKGILRAGVHGPIAIMIPMIINISEFKQAKKLIDQAIEELNAEGKAYTSDYQVGIMVETPAAAVMAEEFAKEVDFFSIGTNDLVQYTLAVDRGNQKVSYLYDHFNPAVVKLIAKTIQAAHENGKWVGMCGEMAGDPTAAPLLIAMGIDELSMSAPSIPKVKEVVRNLMIDYDLVKKVLEFSDPVQIREYLKMVHLR